MAATMTQDALTLDVGTRAAIERLAARWRTSRSAALRRAVHEAEGATQSEEAAAPAPDAEAQRQIAALESLRRSLDARGVDREEWMRVARGSRR